MIPKRIYQIWIKKDINSPIPQKSKEFMDAVKQWCLENNYEYILIDNNSDIYKECLQNSLFCKKQLYFWHPGALSDYIRLYVLNKYGGIYLDSDVKIHKGFGELLDNKYFICCEPLDWKDNKIFGRIDCGTIASIPNNELCKIIIDIFDNYLYNGYLGTGDITKFINRKYNINGSYNIWLALPEIIPFVIEKIMNKQILYINEPKPLNISDNTFDIYNSNFFSYVGEYIEHCFHTTWL